MTNWGSIFIAAITLGLASPTGAAAAHRWDEFPTKNDHLREEVEADAQRGLPKSEHVVWAIDAEIFKPGFHDSDAAKYAYYPYHGIGGWVETRLEIAPLEDLRLNLKLVPWYGTDSYGYHDASRLETYFGLTFDDRIFETDLRWQSRFGDLGFRTIGNGLFIEDRPMNGVDLAVAGENAAFRVIVNGTGALSVFGDLYVTQLELLNGRVILGALLLGKMSFEPEDFPTTPFLALTQPFSWGSLGAEASASRGGQAYLLRARFERDRERWGAKLEPTLRWYEDGVAGSFERSTEQDYTGYDQQSHPYTNAINVFRNSDHAFVMAARTRAFWRAHRSVELYGDLELGNFVFKDGTARDDFLFWEAGVKAFPISTREDYVSLAYTNKLLTAVGENAVAPGNPPDYFSVYPESSDRDRNKPRFTKQDQIIFRLHGRF